MRAQFWTSFVLAGAILTGPAARAAQQTPSVFFAASAEGVSAPGSGTNLYALGTQALNQNRWESAASLFAMAAAEKGSAADGALYWEAYAENKLGHRDRALSVCAQLKHVYPASGWLEECGVLLIEIKSKNGQPVALDPGQSDEVKLLALNALLKQNQSKGLEAAAAILSSDAGEKLKQGVLFLLNEHHDFVTYPQIARLSQVEGDVRVFRGDADEKSSAGNWGQARANLQLYTGFSVVTGKGRAEIEFENASTMYLAENSVLLINNLETLAGIPRTEVALLSGTATVHVRPNVAGEWFYLKTPTDVLVAHQSDQADYRITSYLDGIALAFFGKGVLRLSTAGEEPLEAGTTLFFREGRAIQPQRQFLETDFSNWDQWVNRRYTQRQADMAQMQLAAGLSQPVPGLNELKGHGSFTACAPYGRCWRPDVALASFPCMPNPVRFRQERDPATGKNRVVDTMPEISSSGLDWALCNSGAWIADGSGYLWVASTRRRHSPPIFWVQNGKTVALVPMHPRDVPGETVLNRDRGGFAVDAKDPGKVTPVHFDVGKPVRPLQEPPRDFRAAQLAPLAPAETPRMEVRSLEAAAGSHPAGVPLTFDRKSQNFLAPREVVRGDHTVVTLSPVDNRQGNLQLRVNLRLPPGVGGQTNGSSFSPAQSYLDAGGSSNFGGSANTSSPVQAASPTIGVSSTSTAVTTTVHR
jgi:hypothetical protein